MRSPTDLRVEHLDLPLGITVPSPRLSWRLPPGASRQVAYQIRAGVWDSGRVESDRSLLVSYDGPPLHAGQRVRWTVRVWTDVGSSDWAEPTWWEMGLLGGDDWVARWVEPVETGAVQVRIPHPAYLLRGRVTLTFPAVRGRLHATAHGIYECFVNGHRVGDNELTPGFTSYWSSLHVQTYDVTDLLCRGENVVSAVVSDGWFRGQNGSMRTVGKYGKNVGLLAQLNAEGADGWVERWGTGDDWVYSVGSIRAADLMQGQVVDLREDVSGWMTAAADLHDWFSVDVCDYDMARLRSSPAPPVRRVETVRPIAVTSPRPGRQVVDLGQNITGWVRLSSLGAAGTNLRLTYGEVLNNDGDVTLSNIVIDTDSHPTFGEPEYSNLAAPLQVDDVTSAGNEGQCFEPRHTTHGFRYVRVEGHPDQLSVDDVTGIVVHTDMRRIGWFECSDQRINMLHDAAVWSFRGNACDIPTDCPTRERAGWTGDWQIFVATAAFLYDVAGFSTKWLRDLASEQMPDGRVPDCVPNTQPAKICEDLGIRHGSAGWGDAAVIVPWEIYLAYGDAGLLAEQWPSMRAWVDYAARTAENHRHPSRAALRPIPAPHERFIWDTGFHYGEWLEPGEWDVGDFAANMAALAASDNGDVGTAYLHYSSGLLAMTAHVLGRDEDAVRYRDLATATRVAWQAEFIQPGGTLTRNRQAAYVRALAFGLVPDDLRQQTADRLVDLIQQGGMSLGTGFLATPHLLPVLADSGHLDEAYQLLFRDTEPSWLTMIDRGATTIWEAWNGIDGNGTAHLSLNHYSKGAVISFLHQFVAGIRQLAQEPAYRRFQIAPMPGRGITWASAIHDSPYGRIESSWRIDGDLFTLEAEVPSGTSAQICLPDGQRIDAGPGKATYMASLARL